MDELNVTLHDGTPVGILRRGEGTDYHFAYSGVQGIELSCALPRTQGTNPFTASQTRSYFVGLLPEGRRRERYCERFRIQVDDDFRLLAAIGGECAGAISVQPPGGDMPAAAERRFPVEQRGTLVELIQGGMLISAENRLSLTGAQLKEAMILEDGGTLILPAANAISTHIVKVGAQPGTADEYRDVVVNEYLCLRAAQRVSKSLGTSFSVPDVSLLPYQYYRGGDSAYLLCITRYDRRRDAEGVVHRIHQEDFCQATGKIARYANSGGPTLDELCQVIERHTAVPGLARLQLFDAVLFNYVIGNCDAHGRNFSLLHHEDGKRQLAPLYDLLSTAVYAQLTRELAMPLGSATTLDDVTVRDLDEVAHTLRLSRKAAQLRRAKQMAAAKAGIREAAEELRDAYGVRSDTVHQIVEESAARADRVLRASS